MVDAERPARPRHRRRQRPPAASVSTCSRARGYRALGAASVGEGLRAFGEKQPAAVLLDLKLPDGTGLDVLRELQRRSPVTPVVVVSGYGSVPDAVEAMQLGASEYLEKPVAKERLYDVLDRVLAPVPRRDERPGGARRRTAPGTGWWGAPRPCSASTSSWTWWLPRGRA